MSSRRHHSHKGGTTPTTEPKDRPGVVQFSVSEVVQFSMSLDTPGRLALALAQGRSLERTGAQHPRPSLEVVALIHSSCSQMTARSPRNRLGLHRTMPHPPAATRVGPGCVSRWRTERCDAVLAAAVGPGDRVASHAPSSMAISKAPRCEIRCLVMHIYPAALGLLRSSWHQGLWP